MTRPIAYAPGFDHDIFISYSSRDDLKEAAQADRKGRVSTLVELLDKRLTRMVGPHSIWMDRGRLDGQFQLTPDIEGALAKTAILIAFVSRGYHESQWCPWEREAFLRGGMTFKNGATRVFVVEFSPIEEEIRPKEMTDHKAYRFWSQDLLEPAPRILDPYLHEADYYNKVDALANAITKTLLSLKGAAPSKPPRATVYLAETTDDLEPTWWKVKRYLEGQNIAVAPTSYLPRNEAFESAVKENLRDVELYVQLLSLVPGRKLNDHQTYASHQHECAAAAGIPILQWRDESLKDAAENTIEDPIHRKLLYGPDVQAVRLVDFTQNILVTLDRLRAEKERQIQLKQKADEIAREASERHTNGKSVFIVAHQKDSAVAHDVEQFLATQGFLGGLPITLTARDQEKITPKEIREDFKDNYELADATLVVYGRTPSLWYKCQLTEIGKIRRLRIQRSEMGVLVAPPSKTVTPEEGTYFIPAESGIDEKAFRPFLDAIANPDPIEQPVAVH